MNQINQINKTNLTNQMDQTDQIIRQTGLVPHVSACASPHADMRTIEVLAYQNIFLVAC
jgi:hypothetical protein